MSVIIFRYLSRNLLSTTTGVCAVLLLVIISSRFVKYLAQAASGDLDPGILLALMGYRIPGFLELILPLAFFLSILLAYGQLYVESEMTVLSACGISDRRVMFYTLSIAVLIAVVVGWLSLVLSPAGMARAEALINAQKQRSEVEGLIPGRFYALKGDKGVTYAEQVSGDGMLGDVFLAQGGDDGKGMVVVVADRGYSRQSEETGERYLVFEDGMRFQGLPGRADYQVTTFAEYGQRLEAVKPWELRSEIEAMATGTLLDSGEPGHRAALYWRLSIPVMVLIVTIMAVPLARTNPRQGRFVKILPAVVLYVLYLLSLNAMRSKVEEGEGAGWSMLLVHGVFLAIGLLLAGWNAGWRPYRRGLPAAGGALS